MTESIDALNINSRGSINGSGNGIRRNIRSGRDIDDTDSISGRHNDKDFKKSLKNMFLTFDQCPHFVLPKDHYAAIKKVFRTNAAHVEYAYEACLIQMNRRDSRVRYRCLLFLREVISRSAATRDRIESDFDEIVEKCIIGDSNSAQSQLVNSGLPKKNTTKKLSFQRKGFRKSTTTSKFLYIRNLPEPANVAEDLRDLGLRTVEEWKDVYGSFHPKFVVGYNYLKNSLHLKFPDIRNENIRMGIEREEKKQFSQRVLLAKYHRVLQEVDNYLGDIIITLKESTDIFSLIIPDFETMFQNALIDPNYNKEDIYEYMKLTQKTQVQSLFSKTFEDLEEELDDINNEEDSNEMEDYNLNDNINSNDDIRELENTKIENENDRNQIQILATDSVGKETLNSNVFINGSDSIQGENKIVNFSDDRIQKLLEINEKKQKKFQNLQENLNNTIEEDSNIDANVDSNIDTNVDSNKEEDEWEDVVDSKNNEIDLSDFQDLISFSSVSNKEVVFTLKSTIDELKTKENSEIFEVFSEKMKDIITRYKPMIEEWYSIVSKVEVDNKEKKRHERLYKSIIELKGKIDSLVKKCERINMNLSFESHSIYTIPQIPEEYLGKRKLSVEAESFSSSKVRKIS